MKIKEVGVREWKYDEGHNVILHTSGLEGCVGVSFFEKQGSTLKRSLAHIYHSGSNNEFDLKREVEDAKCLINQMTSHFKNPKVGVVFVPFKYSGDVMTNPLGDYLKNYLIEEGFEVPIIDDLLESPSKKSVYMKDLIVRPDILRVIYKDRGGKRAMEDFNDYSFSEFL